MEYTKKLCAPPARKNRAINCISEWCNLVKECFVNSFQSVSLAVLWAINMIPPSKVDTPSGRVSSAAGILRRSQSSALSGWGRSSSAPAEGERRTKVKEAGERERSIVVLYLYLFCFANSAHVSGVMPLFWQAMAKQQEMRVGRTWNAGRQTGAGDVWLLLTLIWLEDIRARWKKSQKTVVTLLQAAVQTQSPPRDTASAKPPKKEKLKARTPSQFFFPPQISRLAFYTVFNTLMHVQVFIICLVWS